MSQTYIDVIQNCKQAKALLYASFSIFNQFLQHSSSHDDSRDQKASPQIMIRSGQQVRYEIDQRGGNASSSSSSPPHQIDFISQLNPHSQQQSGYSLNSSNTQSRYSKKKYISPVSHPIIQFDNMLQTGAYGGTSSIGNTSPFLSHKPTIQEIKCSTGLNDQIIITTIGNQQKNYAAASSAIDDVDERSKEPIQILTPPNQLNDKAAYIASNQIQFLSQQRPASLKNQNGVIITVQTMGSSNQHGNKNDQVEMQQQQQQSKMLSNHPSSEYQFQQERMKYVTPVGFLSSKMKKKNKPTSETRGNRGNSFRDRNSSSSAHQQKINFEKSWIPHSSNTPYTQDYNKKSGQKIAKTPTAPSGGGSRFLFYQNAITNAPQQQYQQSATQFSYKTQTALDYSSSSVGGITQSAAYNSQKSGVSLSMNSITTGTQKINPATIQLPQRKSPFQNKKLSVSSIVPSIKNGVFLKEKSGKFLQSKINLAISSKNNKPAAMFYQASSNPGEISSNGSMNLIKNQHHQQQEKKNESYTKTADKLSKIRSQAFADIVRQQQQYPKHGNSSSSSLTNQKIIDFYPQNFQSRDKKYSTQQQQYQTATSPQLRNRSQSPPPSSSSKNIALIQQSDHIFSKPNS